MSKFKTITICTTILLGLGLLGGFGVYNHNRSVEAQMHRETERAEAAKHAADAKVEIARTRVSGERGVGAPERILDRVLGSR